MTATTIHNEASRAHVAQQIGNLSLEKRWKVEVKQDRPRRSRSQNNLMWMWIDRAAQVMHQHTGQDKDDIHEFFKDKFCPVRQVTVGNEVFLVKSTKKLTTGEMREYMDAIVGYCASEWGIILPIPEELRLGDDLSL